MTPYSIRLTQEALKDVRKLTPRLKAKLRDLLVEVVAAEPRSGKRLMGDLQGLYSLRLSYQDRIVYSVDEKARIVTVHRARTHYGN